MSIMEILSKNCVVCGQEFLKPKTLQMRAWLTRRMLCSITCRGILQSRNRMRENHPRWNDIPTYVGVHGWLHWNFGSAMRCENRENQTLSFSCSQVSMRFQWANKHNKPYERDRENFFMLCVSCHKKYDLRDRYRLTPVILVNKRAELLV